MHRGQLEERVRAGDKLRFAYTTVRPGYLAIISLDSGGHASNYFPTTERAAAIEAGADVLLPSAIELDDVPGRNASSGCSATMRFTSRRSIES